MARSHNLSPAILKQVADGVAARLSPSLLAFTVGGGKLELGETFEVWSLSRPPDPHAMLADVARSTGYWHHQIRRAGKGVECAQSAPGTAEGEWQVHAVFESDLAAKIDAGVTVLDSDPAFDDAFVRLLIVPSRQTVALWIIAEGQADRLLPIEAPTSANLQSGKTCAESDFLAALAQIRPARATPAQP